MNAGIPRLYISSLVDLDWLIALEFGRVDDGQPPENWEAVTERFGFLREKPGGRVLGFKVLEFSEFLSEVEDVDGIWDGNPIFDAPQLGLTGVTAGEVVLASASFCDGGNSFNRDVFLSAVNAEDLEEAHALWRACLQCGDSMAHFALGYTSYDLGRFPEAYRHLRHYTEISPSGAWNWCWFGKAAEAVGETEEARGAYQRAIAIAFEDETGEETDAGELLAALDERTGASGVSA